MKDEDQIKQMIEEISAEMNKSAQRMERADRDGNTTEYIIQRAFVHGLEIQLLALKWVVGQL